MMNASIRELLVLLAIEIQQECSLHGITSLEAQLFASFFQLDFHSGIETDLFPRMGLCSMTFRWWML